MKIFTYQDYLRYQKFLKEKEECCIDASLVFEVKENEQVYHVEKQNVEDKETYYTGGQLKNNGINNQHDKIFRKILDDKKEASNFINKALNLQYQIKPEDIEKYNSSFVTLELKNQESDIIYKLKTKNVFFLIEHQTKIDYTMPLRILEYENEIIKSAIENSKIGHKGYKFPMVIPIVLYSGRKKWNVKTYIGEIQEELKGYKGLEFSKYNVVDVNNFSEEDLLKDDSFLSKAMLIEKTSYTSNLAIYLEQIVEEVNKRKDVYTKEQRELLATIINLVLKKKLEINEVEKLTKKLKKEENSMLAVLEMIEEENKRLVEFGRRCGKKQGEKEGKKVGEKRGIKKEKIETAKRMLAENADISFIIRITDLTEEEIMKIKDKK